MTEETEPSKQDIHIICVSVTGENSASISLFGNKFRVNMVPVLLSDRTGQDVGQLRKMNI